MLHASSLMKDVYVAFNTVYCMQLDGEEFSLKKILILRTFKLRFELPSVQALMYYILYSQYTLCWCRR